MRVVVPFTNLRPETEKALAASGWPYETVDVSNGDDAYYWLLYRLWAEGATFAIVEHDIVVGPSTLSDMAACNKDWCGYAAPYWGGNHVGMNCVKFSAALIARHPDAMDRIANMSDPKHPPMHWCRLDCWLQSHVLRLYETHHIHAEVLGHAKERLVPSHNCVNP